MKKSIYFFIVIIAIGIIPFCANAKNTNDYFENYNGVKITYDKYENFLKIGFSKEEIQNMSEELYESYSDMDHVLKDKTEEKYFREAIIIVNGYKKSFSEEITKYEYENEIDNKLISLFTDSSYETTYKKITLNSFEVSSSNPNGRAVYATLFWKKLPSTRSYDIFAARTENGEIVVNSYTGSMISKETTFDNDCTISGTKNHVLNYQPTGLAWNLYRNNTIGYTGVGFTGKVSAGQETCTNDIGVHVSTVQQLSSTFSFQTVKGATVYATYQHAQSWVENNSVVKAYSYSSSGLGGVIYFSNSSLRNVYDGMSGVKLYL